MEGAAACTNAGFGGSAGELARSARTASCVRLSVLSRCDCRRVRSRDGRPLATVRAGIRTGSAVSCCCIDVAMGGSGLPFVSRFPGLPCPQVTTFKISVPSVCRHCKASEGRSGQLRIAHSAAASWSCKTGRFALALSGPSCASGTPGGTQPFHNVRRTPRTSVLRQCCGQQTNQWGRASRRDQEGTRSAARGEMFWRGRR